MYLNTLFIVQEFKAKYMPIKINGLDHWRPIDSFYYGEYTTHGYTNTDYAEDRHSQAFYEINIITRGTGTHYFGEKTYPAKRGDVFIIPPNILHGYDGGVGFDVYHLLLSPSFMQKNSANLMRLPNYSTLFHIDPMMRERVSDKLHLHLSGMDFDEVYAHLLEMETLDQGITVAEGIMSEALATIVIAKLCEVHVRTHKNALDTEGDGELLTSISYLYEHYNEKVNIDDLIKMARMSRTAYLAKFKRVTGTTPGKFVAQRRVEVAKVLLSDQSRSLARIAADIGCFDTSHFIRLFLQYTDMTPSEFRASL